MRIRRDRGGKDIVLTCGVDIDRPSDLTTDELQLDKLMELYGIPLAIEMMTRIMKFVVKDFQSSNKEKLIYRINFVAENVSDEA